MLLGKNVTISLFYVHLPSMKDQFYLQAVSRVVVWHLKWGHLDKYMLIPCLATVKWGEHFFIFGTLCFFPWDVIIRGVQSFSPSFPRVHVSLTKTPQVFSVLIRGFKPFLPLLSNSGHVNNLYNTCFWALVHDGVTNTDAVQQLKVSLCVCVCVFVNSE